MELQALEINHLPDEILVNILQRLNVRERMMSALVCRRWDDVAYIGGWEALTTYDYGQLKYDGSITQASFVYSHSNGSCMPENDQVYTAVIKRASATLQRVVGIGRFLPVSNLLDMFTTQQSWPCLTVLDMSQLYHLCGPDPSGKAQALLLKIGQVLGSQLIELHMAAIQMSDEQSQIELFTCLTALRVLNISHNRAITGRRSFEFLPKSLWKLDIGYCLQIEPEAVQLVGSSCLALQELKASYVQFDPNSTHLKHLAVLEPGAFAQLRHCYLNYNSRVTDQSLHTLVEQCGLMEHLVVSYCKNVTDAGFARLALMTHLKHLAVDGTNFGVEALRAIAKLGKLEILCARYCRHLCAKRVEEVALGSQFKKMTYWMVDNRTETEKFGKPERKIGFVRLFYGWREASPILSKHSMPA